MGRMIKLEYSVFQTIEEQLNEQGWKCKNVKEYDHLLDCILHLYLGEVLTDSMKNKCIERLHKMILRDIRRENK